MVKRFVSIGSPPCQLDTDPGGYPLDDQHQHDQAQQDRAHLVPAIGAHGEDQRRADTARAHQAQHRGVAQVHVEAVDDGGGKVRRQLRQNAVADLLERGAARGVQRLQDALVQVLDALDKHLGHHADGAQGHGQQAREGTGAGDADEHQAVDKGGDGTDSGDQNASHQRQRLGDQIAGGDKRQGQRDHRAHDGAQKGDAERLQQQIRHTVGAQCEQQLGGGMEDTGDDIPGYLQPVAGGVAGLYGRAGPRQQAGHDEGRQQLPQPRFRRGGVGFLNSLFHTALLTSVSYAGRG